MPGPSGLQNPSETVQERGQIGVGEDFKFLHGFKGEQMVSTMINLFTLHYTKIMSFIIMFV